MLTIQARDAVRALGNLIAIGRKTRGWTTTRLAEQAGISRTTLYRIERGDEKVAVGTVFDVASLVGVRLLGVDDPAELAALGDRLEDRLAVLPGRVVPIGDEGLDDDF